MYAQHQFPVQSGSPYLSTAHHAQAQALAQQHQLQANAQTAAYSPHPASRPPPAGTPVTAHLHPQLPQLNSYPHLQQYTYSPIPSHQVQPYPQPGATLVGSGGSVQATQQQSYTHAAQIAQAQQASMQHTQALQAQYYQQQQPRPTRWQQQQPNPPLPPYNMSVYQQPRPQPQVQIQPPVQPQIQVAPQAQLQPQPRPIARQPSSRLLAQRAQQNVAHAQHAVSPLSAQATLPHPASQARPIVQSPSSSNRHLSQNHPGARRAVKSANDNLAKSPRKNSSQSGATISRGATPIPPSPLAQIKPPREIETSGKEHTDCTNKENDGVLKGATGDPASKTSRGPSSENGDGKDGAGENAIPPGFPYFGKEFALPTYIPAPFAFWPPPPFPDVGHGAFAEASYPEEWLDHEGLNGHPLLQPGLAADALRQFAEGLQGMTGGTHAEWTDFIEEQFDDASRFQLTLPRPTGLTLHDVQSSSLPRIFSSFPSSLDSTRLHLTGHVEKPLWSAPQSPYDNLSINSLPRHGVQVDSEGEWRWSYADRTGAKRSRPDEPEPQCEKDDVVWKVSVSSTWVAVLEEGVLKMETMEIFIHSIHVPARLESLVDNTGLPGKVVQILQIVSDMEDMTDIIGLSHEGHLPRGLFTREYASGVLTIDALKVLTVDRLEAAGPTGPTGSTGLTGPTGPTEPTETIETTETAVPTETAETAETAEPTETAETAEPNEPIEETEMIETAEPTQPAQPTGPIETDETVQCQPIRNVADIDSNNAVGPAASDKEDDLKMSATPLSADPTSADPTLESREFEAVDEGDKGVMAERGATKLDTLETLDTDTEVKQERDLKVDMDFEGVQQQEQGEEYWDLDME